MSTRQGRVVVVTGTSTGVGKTVATAALTVRALAAGESVVVVKPVQTGVAEGDSDAAEVHRLTGCAVECGFSPSRPGDQLVYVTDFRKLRHHTGWQPKMDVRATLECMHAWWRTHSELFDAAERPLGTTGRGCVQVAA